MPSSSAPPKKFCTILHHKKCPDARRLFAGWLEPVKKRQRGRWALFVMPFGRLDMASTDCVGAPKRCSAFSECDGIARVAPPCIGGHIQPQNGAKLFWRSTRLLSLLLFFPFLLLAAPQYHAVAMNGTPKYPADFQHFDYVNPDAPKGGHVKADAFGTFDSLHGFVIKGNPADDLGLIYDTLTTQSEDEAFTEYGLLAETIELPDDRSWVTFHLRKEAKFHDGKPVTASDVVFTFNKLTTEGNPVYQRYYAGVKEVKALDSRTVRFDFEKGVNRELPLIIGQLPVLPEHYWKDKDFGKASMDVPLGSGPYKIESVDPGRSITYVRVEDYWAKDLPVNKGRYNYDRITDEYYRDRLVALEAFKAGNLDYRIENTAKVWATAYDIDAVKKGWMVKAEIPHQNPQGMQGFVFNTRRAIFADARVREALGYAFNFEWTNKNLFYSQYQRTTSYFDNSELASSGLPNPEELKLLEPLKANLPPEVFTEEYHPPMGSADGNIRKQLREAMKLLTAAGWQVRDGKLTNAKGEPFEFEMLLVLPDFERIVLPFAKNLEQLGIKMNVRTVDTSQYLNRLRDYDYDMIVGNWGQSISPGNEQRYFWHSESADVPGNRNHAGIKNPAVDSLVEKVIAAPTRQELVMAVRALDRALLFGHYVIPHFHIAYHRIAYWDKFERPKVQPPYSLGFSNWWINPAKAKKLFQHNPDLKR